MSDTVELEDDFVDALGLVIDEVSATRVTGHLDIRPDHLQPYGIVHGGVYCAVVETLASYGAAVAAAERVGHAYVVGVSNATDFVRPVHDGRIDAVAEPIHVGRTSQLWQVTLTRDGKLVATGRVRLQTVAPEVVAGGAP